MKLSKAIDILTIHLQEGGSRLVPDIEDALKLGIEALRCLEGLHKLPYGSPLPPLPGETKE